MPAPTDRPYPTPWRVVEVSHRASRKPLWFGMLDAEGKVIVSNGDRTLLDRIVAAVNEKER